ncbi:MAG: MBL fold metallo-hydrolase [Candidatus Saccharibacteria bacterium]|nr:MBL fold metallo-hydrolase [Candidatus Saccharibacteria bacterium]
MKIEYLGHSSYQIKSQSKLVLDPYGPQIGELPAELTADVVTVSHQHFDHNYTDGVSDNPQIIDGPGEFSIKGFDIKGIKSFHDNEGGAKRGDNIIFCISTENIKLCHLGDLGHILSAEQVQEIGNVDILMIPVGGYYTIDANEAVQVVRQINPSIVMPMHFKPQGSPLQLPIEGVGNFNKLLGWDVIERMDELEISGLTIDLLNKKIVIFKK